MTMKAIALVALLASQAPTEPAEAPETPAQAAGRVYSISLLKQLLASESPRERALAARSEEPAVGGKILRAAAQAAPTDVLVQVIWSTNGELWSGCEASSPCPEQAIAWERVEPRNGFARMAQFAGRGKSGSEASIDADIAHIARAERYDDHMIELWRAYRRAIAARPMPLLVAGTLRGNGAAPSTPQAARDEAESIWAMAYAAALPIPMHSLMRACRRADHPQAPIARFEDCARIGRGIVQSDSAGMSKKLGSALVRVSGFENDADRQLRRELEWRQNSAVTEERERPGYYAQYFADLDSTGSETRAQELAMARRGIPLEPPADWQP